MYHYHSVYDSFHYQAHFIDPHFHKHVDIAKVMGLMSLRLADTLVLPINTTQYADELVLYLKKVQHIVQRSGMDDSLQLGGLGEAIQTLGKASRELDIKAEKAIEKLIKLLPKRPKHKKGAFGRWLGGWKGCGSHDGEEAGLSGIELWSDSADTRSIKHGHEIPPMKNMKKIKEVLKEIRAINKKKQGFEGGFISEEGIKVGLQTYPRNETQGREARAITDGAA